MFEDCKVEADSVADFLEKYYKHHNSITGRTVAYFGPAKKG